MDIPEINKTYNCFDDGKICKSRLYKVTIKEIVPFKKADMETLEQWKSETVQCNWLYAKETDYFIKSWNGSDIETFVRTKNSGWFSMGYWSCGRLDIDGSLTKLI